MKRILIAAALLGMAGCASDYSKFYRSNPGATPEAVARDRAAPAPAVPKLDESGDSPQNIAGAYARYGYVPIGYSSFSSGHNESEKGALEQGAKVGADVVVVVNPQFAGSRSSVIPFTTPTAQTSYSTGSATAYGSGGSVTAVGNSTTTTYGSRTTYIPVTVDRYEYGAIYFIKKKYELGANWRDLNDSERQQFQTNRGAYIISVVNDTPAFNSDLLAGDVILAINGQPSDVKGYAELLRGLKGQTVELSIDRAGQHIQKTVRLGD